MAAAAPPNVLPTAHAHRSRDADIWGGGESSGMVNLCVGVRRTVRSSIVVRLHISAAPIGHTLCQHADSKPGPPGGPVFGTGVTPREVEVGCPPAVDTQCTATWSTSL